MRRKRSLPSSNFFGRFGSACWRAADLPASLRAALSRRGDGVRSGARLRAATLRAENQHDEQKSLDKKKGPPRMIARRAGLITDARLRMRDAQCVAAAAAVG